VGVKYKLVDGVNYVSNNDNFNNTQIFSTTDTLDNLSLKFFRYGVSLSKNNLNRKQYPTSGTEMELAVDYFSGNETYNPGNTALINKKVSSHREWFRIKFLLKRYLLEFGRYRGGYLLESVFSNQPVFLNFTATLMNAPAFYPLQDSRTLFLENFRAHNFVAAGVMNAFSINKNLDFRLEGYLFKPVREIRPREPGSQIAVYKDFNNQVYACGTAGLVYHSPVGPVSLSMNYYDDRENQLGGLLHFGYLIYNKKSME
jgi:NTE family protein